MKIEDKKVKGKKKFKVLVRVLSFPFPHITSSRQAIKQRKEKREKELFPFTHGDIKIDPRARK